MKVIVIRSSETWRYAQLDEEGVDDKEVDGEVWSTLEGDHEEVDWLLVNQSMSRPDKFLMTIDRKVDG